MIIVNSTNNAKKARKEFEEKNSTEALAREAQKDSIARANDSIYRLQKQYVDSINNVQREKDVKNTIKLKSAYLGHPNSASGVDAYFYYKNTSSKTIKYLVWTGVPYNAVGDPVTCEIRGYSDYRGKDTGPVKPNASSGGVWRCAWYNWSAKTLKIVKIEIEYMDGSSFVINENEISLIK